MSKYLRLPNVGDVIRSKGGNVVYYTISKVTSKDVWFKDTDGAERLFAYLARGGAEMLAHSTDWEYVEPKPIDIDSAACSSVERLCHNKWCGKKNFVTENKCWNCEGAL